jgi:hypothetical protein
MQRDYYQILEIAQNATQESIREQYLFLVNAWHPDKFQNAIQKIKAEEKVKLINEAYEILGNPQKRVEYDIRNKNSSSRFNQGYKENKYQQQTDDEIRRKEEAERRAKEEQWQRERVNKEREEAERRANDYKRHEEQKNKEREETRRSNKEEGRNPSKNEPERKPHSVKNYYQHIIMIVIILILVLSISFAFSIYRNSAISTTTNNSTPNNGIQYIPLSLNCDQLIYPENPKYKNIKCDDFSESNSWAVASSESSKKMDSNGKLSVKLANTYGYYNGGAVYMIVHPELIFPGINKVYISVDVENSKDDESSLSNLFFGYSDYKYCLLQLDSFAGKYRYLSNENDYVDETDVTGWVSSNTIRTKMVNRISMNVYNKQADLYINGSKVNTLPCNLEYSISQISFELFVLQNKTALVNYDNFIISYE